MAHASSIAQLMARPPKERFPPGLMAMATESPGDLPTLAEAILTSKERGWTFLDTTLTLMPVEGFARLVPLAVTRLESHGTDENAESVIEYTALQSGETLRPFLTRLFALERLARRGEIWRMAGPEHERFLLDHARTRDVAGQRARSLVGELRTDEALAASGRALTYGSVKKKPGGYRRLYTPRPLHVVFDPEHAGPPRWLTVRPSCWTSDVPRTARFGGVAACECSVCGERAHHVLTLDPIPASLELHGLSRLELVTCLSCLGWSHPTLSFQHDSEGHASPAPMGKPVRPGHPSPPLLETRVGLADQGARWTWQEWGFANSRENLHRVGGFPSFVQSPIFPRCPSCDRRSRFLLQLDSGLPLEGGDSCVEWGSGGIAYGYFCERCRVSTWQWQCT